MRDEANLSGADLRQVEAYVSVPLRGKEGAGQMKGGKKSKCAPEVSVPLRGKEGAGPEPVEGVKYLTVGKVSVPLRGKEGAGQRRATSWLIEK